MVTFYFETHKTVKTRNIKLFNETIRHEKLTGPQAAMVIGFFTGLYVQEPISQFQVLVTFWAQRQILKLKPVK